MILYGGDKQRRFASFLSGISGLRESWETRLAAFRLISKCHHTIPYSFYILLFCTKETSRIVTFLNKKRLHALLLSM